jgi:hypothetical protein
MREGCGLFFAFVLAQGRTRMALTINNLSKHYL